MPRKKTTVGAAEAAVASDQPDFASARVFITQAENCLASGDQSGFVAARYMAVVALGLSQCR